MQQARRLGHIREGAVAVVAVQDVLGPGGDKEMMHDRRLREINAALYRRVRRQIGALVAQGIEVGTFRRVDVVQAAAVVLALVDGVSLQLTFDPRAFGAAAAVRLCEDVLTRYLEKEAP